MKSRRSKSHTSPQVVRTFRVDETREPKTTGNRSRTGSPSYRIEELPLGSAMNSLHSLTVQTAMARDLSPTPGLLGPINQGIRRVSGGDSSPSPSMRIPSGASAPSGQTTTNGVPQSASNGTDIDSSGSQWSTAIGYAATGGKSGRVIERLMAENDRLKRELELQILRVQDLEKSAQTYKPQIEALHEKVDSLAHANTMDANLLARRDRRIEELRADNAQLKDGKDALHRRLRETERERDETREQTQRDIQTMTESTKHATIHADILETSHRQLSAEYRARREAWEHDLNAILDRQEQEYQRMTRLDIVCEQMRHENERSKKIMSEMISKWETYEAAIKEGLSANNEATDRINLKSVELQETVDQMRWVMGIKKNTNLDSQPPSETRPR